MQQLFGSVGAIWNWKISRNAFETHALKRSFDIDIEHCPNCGGTLKIIAAIEDPLVIVKILTHLGLSTRAPPHSPAQRFDLFQTI